MSNKAEESFSIVVDEGDGWIDWHDRITTREEAEQILLSLRRTYAHKRWAIDRVLLIRERLLEGDPR